MTLYLPCHTLGVTRELQRYAIYGQCYQAEITPNIAAMAQAQQDVRR